MHANQQAPEEALAEIGLHSFEDAVELDHLQRHGQKPINVISVRNWGLLDSHPALTHVEVLHRSDEGHEYTHMQKGLPVVAHGLRLNTNEDRGSDHGNGDDPERDADTIIGLEKNVLLNDLRWWQGLWWHPGLCWRTSSCSCIGAIMTGLLE